MPLARMLNFPIQCQFDCILLRGYRLWDVNDDIPNWLNKPIRGGVYIDNEWYLFAEPNDIPREDISVLGFEKGTRPYLVQRWNMGNPGRCLENVCLEGSIVPDTATTWLISSKGLTGDLRYTTRLPKCPSDYEIIGYNLDEPVSDMKLPEEDLEDAEFRGKDLAWSQLVKFFNLKKERDGFTQRELAAKVGITEARVSQMLKAPFNMTLQTLGVLAEGMDLDLNIVLKERSGN